MDISLKIYSRFWIFGCGFQKREQFWKYRLCNHRINYKTIVFMRLIDGVSIKKKRA